MCSFYFRQSEVVNALNRLIQKYNQMTLSDYHDLIEKYVAEEDPSEVALLDIFNAQRDVENILNNRL
jgi:hypothetical protein